LPLKLQGQNLLESCMWTVGLLNALSSAFVLRKFRLTCLLCNIAFRLFATNHVILLEKKEPIRLLFLLYLVFTFFGNVPKYSI